MKTNDRIIVMYHPEFGIIDVVRPDGQTPVFINGSFLDEYPGAIITYYDEIKKELK